MKKPMVGIVSSYNEIVPGHMNLDKIVEAVKLGVAMAGGDPPTAFRVLGVVLGACYSPTAPDPRQQRQLEYSRFSDGTVVFYDREAHKLFAHVEGDAEIETKGTITAKAQKDIRVESATNITLRAPTITLAGLLTVTDKDGQAGSGELLGHYRILEGGLDVPDADVTAGAVSVRGHIHKGVEAGPSTTGTPVGG